MYLNNKAQRLLLALIAHEQGTLTVREIFVELGYKGRDDLIRFERLGLVQYVGEYPTATVRATHKGQLLAKFLDDLDELKQET